MVFVIACIATGLVGGAYATFKVEEIRNKEGKY